MARHQEHARQHWSQLHRECCARNARERLASAARLLLVVLRSAEGRVRPDHGVAAQLHSNAGDLGNRRTHVWRTWWGREQNDIARQFRNKASAHQKRLHSRTRVHERAGLPGTYLSDVGVQNVVREPCSTPLGGPCVLLKFVLPGLVGQAAAQNSLSGTNPAVDTNILLR